MVHEVLLRNQKHLIDSGQCLSRFLLTHILGRLLLLLANGCSTPCCSLFPLMILAVSLLWADDHRRMTAAKLVIQLVVAALCEGPIGKRHLIVSHVLSQIGHLLETSTEASYASLISGSGLLVYMLLDGR